MRNHCVACRGWLEALALIIGVGIGSPAGADEPPSPRNIALSESHAARAFEAYQNQQYAVAIELYEQAYEAAPNAGALYNIARVYDLGLRDRPKAMEAYQRYVSDPGATAERIQRASERLQQLQEAEATARSVRTDPGTVTPHAAPPAAVAPMDATAQQGGDSGSRLRAPALACATLGLIGVGVGTGFGLAVLSKADTVDSLCDGNRCSTERGVVIAKTASRQASIATLGMSLGAGLMVTGFLLWLIDSGSPSDPATARALRLSPSVDALALGMDLSGSW